MNPKIQSQQANTTDLSKLKSSVSGMPKTEKKDNDKLASTLSGNTKASFGLVSNNKSSLESSLSVKAGSTDKTSSDSTTVSNPVTQNDTGIFSYSEQLDMKSKLGTIDSDITTAKNSSIFDVKASATSSTTTTSTISNSDISSKSMAQTYITAAKDYAAKAESYAQGTDWANVIAYYQKAQTELAKAQQEIQKASQAGEDVKSLSDQSAALTTTYSQNMTSASKFLASRTIKNNVASAVASANSATATPGFWSSLGSGFQQGISDGISNMFGPNGSSGSGNSQQAGGTGGSSSSSKAGGSGSSSGITGDNNPNKLQYDKEYENAVPSSAKSDFEAAKNESGDAASAILEAQGQLTDVDSEIKQLDSDINKINGESETYLEEYKAAKADEAENQQTIDKETATQTEQQKLYDDADAKCKDLMAKEGQKNQDIANDNIAVDKAETELDTANDEKDKAEDAVDAAKDEMDSAQKELNNAKDEKARAAAQTRFTTAKTNYEAKQRELTAAKQKVVEKEQAKREADDKLKADEAELKQIQADTKTYTGQRDGAKDKLDAAGKRIGELNKKKGELSEKIKKTGEVLSTAKGDIAKLRDKINSAYSKQTKLNKTISDNKAIHDAAQTKMQTAQEVTDHAVQAAKDKKSKGFWEGFKGLF